MDNQIYPNKKKLDVLKLVSIIAVSLMHIVFIVLVISGIRYFNLSKATILGVIGTIVCMLTIIDVIFIYCLRGKHLSLKIIVLSISLLLTIVGSIGLYYLTIVNINVNKIVDNEEDSQYETIRVVVVTYDNDNIKDIDDLNGKTVGSLNTSGISAASIGKQNLEDNGVSATFKEYNTTSDLYIALVEEEIDAAIFSNTFMTQLSNDDETYDEYFERTDVIYEYDEKVQTNDDELSKKDLSSDPFTVLLIGYAPEAGGGGLTDTIILAAVNPKTMTVSMTSIARDSYVPISCYGNNRSKINDAGAASNSCLIDTVENLMGVDIDFYMRVNFQGVVDIVDALGGIIINSPVAFVGQSSSSSRGKYNVWVPQGEINATGEQALAFARERHAMPGGDFDRQIHQQEVIQQIAQKTIELKDINKALKILEVAGDNFSTNMSVSQITSVFNYIISAPNYTGQLQHKIIDIKMSRLTGYTYWFYSYSMRLPLWSYYIYDGSIKENVALIKDTLGIYDDIKQWPKMNIFAKSPYVRYPVYTEYFNEPHIPDDIPPIYPNLIGYTYDAAIAWARENGVSINWISIDEDSPQFNESQLGLVVAQDPRKGALIEEYPVCTLTVMGSMIPEENKVPDFVDSSLELAIKWCNNNGISYSITEIPNTNIEKSYLVVTQSVKPGSDKTKISKIEFTYYQKVLKQITAESLNALKGKTQADVSLFCANNGIISYRFVEDIQSYGYSCGSITRTSPESGNTETSFTFFFAPHNYVEDQELFIAPTCGKEGQKGYKCVCGAKYTEVIQPTGEHTWTWSDCDIETATKTGTCTTCGATTIESCGDPAELNRNSLMINDLFRFSTFNKKISNKYYYIKKKES